MLRVLSSPIRVALKSAGLQINRIRRAPYAELWDVPRFTETPIQLLGRPFRIADSRSFFFSYQEIFVQEIYKFNSTRHSPRILDCGSNYGASIVYFQSLYPHAKITGVEADPAIYALLKANCAHLDVELLNVAVSDTNEPLKFYTEGSDGGRAAACIDGAKSVITVNAVTLDDLIGSDSIDFLKIDIEGSEGAALDTCTKLSQVEQMFIEYHSFKEASQTLGRMLEKLKAEGFRYYIHKQFCSPAPLTKEELQLGMDLQLNIFAKRL